MALVYPSLTTYPPTEYYELEPEWPGIEGGDYQDGGKDFLSLADTPIRRWYVKYQHYLTTERDLFRSLAQSARYNPNLGSLISFSFTPLNDGTLAGVQFDKNGLTCVAEPAAGQSLHTITIKLIKRP
ncbi:MAG: hypothetical protein DMF68_13580 [Acidobacteria bacterium]|nr:MAG: hypothetical protein DMF68_13580 [Acidobacteriota bacterium]